MTNQKRINMSGINMSESLEVFEIAFIKRSSGEGPIPS